MWNAMLNVPVLLCGADPDLDFDLDPEIEESNNRSAD